MRLGSLCGVVVLATVACSTDAPDTSPTTTWVGTITTEGNVTTVVNESGSVWGGTAALVEEASIGVDVGDEPYMFGIISAIHADAERIYVVDAQIPVVRVYGHDGDSVGNLGRSGQGPGEYVSPSLLASDGAGRVFVLDSRQARINVYDRDSGEAIDEWPFEDSRCCAWPMFALSGDAVWAPVQRWVEGNVRERVFGAQQVGPSGRFGEIIWVPEIEYEPATYTLSDSDYPIDAPYGPRITWNLTPSGGVVAGATDTYRFQIQQSDGSLLVVERLSDPVPLSREQREYERRYAIAFQRRGNDPAFVWDGAQIPDAKPAYAGLTPALSGEIWVWRYGASERLTDCVEDPIEAGWDVVVDGRCWTDQWHTDVFAADGRYLGEVAMPEDAYTPAVIDGDFVIAQTVDDDGTYRVKRYRLVLPGEEER